MKKLTDRVIRNKDNVDVRRMNIVKTVKISYIISASLTLLLGVFMLIFPDFSGENFFCYILGLVSIIMGAAKLIAFHSNDMYRLAFQFDFAYGLFAVIIGLLLIIIPETMLYKFLTIYCIFVILDGLLKIQTSLDARKFGMKWRFMLVSAVVISLLGIATLFDLFEYNSSVFSINNLTGFLLIVDSSETIWITSFTVRVRAHKKNFSERFGDIEL